MHSLLDKLPTFYTFTKIQQKSIYMKTRFLPLFLILMLWFGLQSNAQDTNKPLLGEWLYEIPDAGPGYDKGNLVLTEKDGAIVCVVKLQGGEITAENLKIKGDSITFATFVQGNTYKIRLKLENEKLQGTVSSNEGAIPMSAVKIVPIFGEWLYEVSDAPYGYEKGSLIFSDTDGKITGAVKLEAGELPINNLKIDKDSIVFSTMVDGSTINVALKLEQGKLIGKVDSPEGPKTLTAIRK
jgi:hypothetical protein